MTEKGNCRRRPLGRRVTVNAVDLGVLLSFLLAGCAPPTETVTTAAEQVGVQRVDKPPAVTDIPAEHELAFRVSQLLIRIRGLKDPANAHQLRNGKDTANVSGLLRDFAGNKTFASRDPRYSGQSSLEVLAVLRPQIKDKAAASRLETLAAVLSNMEAWIADRSSILSDPTKLGGAVIDAFVLPGWRAMDYPYLDCPPDAPFC